MACSSSAQPSASGSGLRTAPAALNCSACSNSGARGARGLCTASTLNQPSSTWRPQPKLIFMRAPFLGLRSTAGRSR
jgi:hypothetical protein